MFGHLRIFIVHTKLSLLDQISHKNANLDDQNKVSFDFAFGTWVYSSVCPTLLSKFVYKRQNNVTDEQLVCVVARMLKSRIGRKIEVGNLDLVLVLDLDVDLQVVGSAERRITLLTKKCEN